jgi:ABC-type multidrug transport system fused ATPase/permease subunit
VQEYFVRELLEELKEQMTVIIIAHRYATVSGADQILVLEDGRLVENGTAKELLERKNSTFSTLFTPQLPA